MLLKENELRATFYRNRSSEELKRFESGSTRREMDTPSVLMVNTALIPSPWKESYDQPRQHSKKQRHHFANKGPYSQSYGFSSSHDGCESWAIKKTEHQRTDAFELWCWRRLLRVPWTARRANQSILEEISPEYSLEGPMLKFQYFGHLM